MLVIQYPGEDEDLQGQLQTIATDALASFGGSMDGGDLDSGTINVFCTVDETNAVAATKAIVGALDQAGIAGAIIAFIDEDDADSEPNVLYPDDFDGTFSVS